MSIKYWLEAAYDIMHAMNESHTELPVQVLLLEDNMMVARMLISFLPLHSGDEIEVAHHAKNVVEVEEMLSAGITYDVAILDQNVPDKSGRGRNGGSVAKLIRESDATSGMHHPIIIHTASLDVKSWPEGSYDMIVEKNASFKAMVVAILSLAGRE